MIYSVTLRLAIQFDIARTSPRAIDGIMFMTASNPIAVPTEPQSPSAAIDAVCVHLNPLDTESISLAQSSGRVLAEAVRADRANPALDMSSMDGFAVRVADLNGMASTTGLPMATGADSEASIGHAPVSMQPGHAIRIVTGAPIPIGADAVVRHEDVRVQNGFALLQIAASAVQPGAFIRRAGENAPQGAAILQPGTLIGAAAIGALATFGASSVRVHRRVRVTIITTGDELVTTDRTPDPWQIRDSNGSVLASLLGARAWIEVVAHLHAKDDADALAATLAKALDSADAVILTGGVSMGHHDHVPQVIERLGADTVFHRLPQRPGRPMLAAVLPRAGTRAPRLILGLPGNPVSVMVTARRLGIPMLGQLAGLPQGAFTAPRLHIDGDDGAQLGMWWFRLVSERVTADGERRLQLLPTKSSGDIAAAAMSTGFVEVPPNQSAAGANAFYPWMH
jgi:molybdopterin molybdotransferase